MKKRNLRLFFFLIGLTVSVLTIKAQAEEISFRLHYVINIEKLDSAFSDNTERSINFQNWLEEISADSMIVLRHVSFKGTASPDGGLEFNQWLCRNRLRTFKAYVRQYKELPDSIIVANVADIPWDGFREKVADTTNYVPYRDEVLAIIDQGAAIVPWFNNRHIDWRLLQLKKMYHGQVWDVLKDPTLKDLRYGEAIFEYHRLIAKNTPPR